MSERGDQRICAVRLPGASRARFADACDVELKLGDWVVMETAAGQEAGRIVVAPDQWLTPVERDDAVPVRRLLTDEELAELAGQMDRSSGQIDHAATTLRQHAPGAFLSGLRYTLDGLTAVASVVGRVPEDAEALTGTLESLLDVTVILEQEHGGSPESTLLSGGTGRVAGQPPETFRELLARRFDVVRDPGTFAPHGLPRLGTTVETPVGAGQLVAVDIRHWKATVAREDGEEITVPVDDLRQPG